ncbi:major facilitator superfamily domain-containing protein [Entophlyctis helioformis]|nr:major facilitator superfamily domain-containing protein [Entophlyctis helioformis]
MARRADEQALAQAHFQMQDAATAMPSDGEQSVLLIQPSTTTTTTTTTTTATASIVKSSVASAVSNAVSSAGTELSMAATGTAAWWPTKTQQPARSARGSRIETATVATAVAADSTHADDISGSRPMPPLSLTQMVLLTSFWLGFQFFWFLQSIVLLPSQILSIMGPDAKGTGLAVVSLSSGLLYMLVSPPIGAINDRFVSRAGRRMPYIVGGTLAMAVSLFSLWGSMPLWEYTLGYLVLNLASAVASVPFNALLADVTPADQNGRVSAVMGAANLSGYLLGALAGVFVQSLDHSQVYAVMILVLCGFMAPTALYTREPPPHYKRRSSASALADVDGDLMATPQPGPIRWTEFAKDMLRPLWTHRDFCLVFVSRLLYQLGIATVQQFLQYWIQDCVVTDLSPTRAVSIGLLPNLLLAPLAATLIPKHHRKVVVYVATALMVATCLLIMVVRDFGWVLAVSALFGIGFGPFISVEFAMLMDVLPNAHDAARDMSLWHMALVVPQIVATPVAGGILDAVQAYGNARGQQCLGYKVVYGLCILYFLAGVLVTTRIRRIK